VTVYADLLLLAILVLDFFLVTTSRLAACVRSVAIQGAALALLPLLLWGWPEGSQLYHLIFLAVASLAIKAILVPRLLSRTIRHTGVRHEVEPYVSMHLSGIIAGVLIATAFWLSWQLGPPQPVPSVLLAPVAFATILLGFLVVVSRKKAITQVIGYLMLENGIFIYGQALTREFPFVVELCLLLDLLVGIFVFGITIHHISRAFDDIDVDALVTLTD
jgi:hydrogenase-4 component E